MMSNQEWEESDWMAYLSQTYAITPDTLNRLWDEFLTHTAMTVKEYVLQRHSQLKIHGWQNQEIYSTLINEIEQQRFKSPKYSIRQMRRMIYG